MLLGAAVHAQVKRPLTWQEALNTLDSVASGALDERRDVVRQIRGEVEKWLKMRPSAAIGLPPTPEGSWTEEQTKTQAAAVHTAIENILKSDPNHPFLLGSQEVTVSASLSDIAPAAATIDQTEIARHDAVTVAKAVEYLPGVSINHISGNRNEAGVYVRGFSSRGQVPLFLDGIPIYVPYDGYVDFNRFVTSDIAEVQVSKGFSSPLLGPNALGGSINLLTKEPVEKYQGEALIGSGSGNGLLSSLNLGTRWQRFFVQGSVDWLQSDFIPLSGNFVVQQYTNLPDITMSHEQNNSHSRDEKYSGRVGWMPKSHSEYVFSYINQKGQKGVPLYTGPYTNATYRNFWDWPFWNKNSYYFISNTGFGEKNSLKTRVFYDQFMNGINMFCNDTYSTMTCGASNPTKGDISRYDDHADGASAVFTTRTLARNVIGVSVFFKDDTHKQPDTYPQISLSTPIPVLRDQQTSFAIQDGIALTSHLYATVGFSADHLNGLQTQYVDSNSKNTTYNQLLPYKCTASPNNTSFAGCTANFWSYNPQASLSYSFRNANTVFVTFADRSRFPVLKDRYSAGMGSALPNPDLKPERARSWNFGYSRTFASKTLAQVELFRSDLYDAIESAYVVDPAVGTGTPANPEFPPLFCPNSKTAGTCSQNVNIGKEIHQGVELTVHSTPFSKLTFDANYTYLSRTIKYDFSKFPAVSQPLTGTPVPPTGLPKNNVVAIATLRLPRQALAMASMRYEGGITLQDTYGPQGYSAPYFRSAFATVDLGAWVPIRSGVSLQAGLKNLLDRNYYYTAGYPEAGRSWYFNLRYRFTPKG